MTKKCIDNECILDLASVVCKFFIIYYLID